MSTVPALTVSRTSIDKSVGTLERERQKRSFLAALALASLLFGGSIWTALEAVSAASALESESFGALTLQGLYFSLAILLRHMRRPVSLFEPYTMVTLVYVLVYHVAPVFQFSLGNSARYGVDAMPQTVEAVALVITGHFFFTLAYGFVGRKKPHGALPSIYREPVDKRRLAKIAYIAFAVCYALAVYYQIGRGFSLSYVMTGGLTGEQSGTVGESSLMFLSYFRYACVGAWAVAFAYGQNRVAKVISFTMLLAIVFFSGTRAAILVPILVPIVIHYIQKGEAPSLVSLGIAAGLLVLLFAVMQVTRGGVAAGSGFDIGGSSVDDLFSPFYAEIDDFKVFYSILGVVPERHDFLYGSQMILYSLVLLVPRAIWPGKPMPQVYDIVNATYGNQAVLNGVAYPNLGEYYVEFGVIGVVVCMFVLGLLCRYARDLYIKRQGLSLSLVLYSLIYGALFQIIIRGYMPQNFTMMLFLLAPVVLVAIVNKRSLRTLEH